MINYHNHPLVCYRLIGLNTFILLPLVSILFFIMALQTEAAWKDFVKSAGITDDAVSSTYAKKFTDNGFNEQSLAGLDKDSLVEMGITMIGHRLAILQRASALNASTAASPTHATVAKASVTANLSTLTLEMTRPQFRKFQQDWTVYKQITLLQPSQTTAHLYNACNEEVQTSLINTHPDFLKEVEDNALKLIESIVTIRSNPAVHRKAFAELVQEEGQAVKTYGVRLRSAATDCAFQCPGCQYDLSAINIKDQLIRGLNNSNLQAEVLAKANQLKTLEDVESYAESFESALRDQTMLSNNNPPPDTLFKFSAYKKKLQQQLQQKQKKTSPQQCNGCGDKSHGQKRSTECEAWGTDCEFCGKPNHFATVCRQNIQKLVQQLELACKDSSSG